ncbi:MAG: hypothetical protein ABII82_04360 [Verrucomicrobiota bacterium]
MLNKETDAIGLFHAALAFPLWIYEMLKPAKKPVPWMNAKAVRELSKLSGHGIRVFEYGSGSSTLYFLSRGCHTFSIEHDSDWHAKVAAMVNASAARTLLLVPPETRTALNSAFASQKKEFGGLAFERYVKSIDAHPDGYFDMVLVDGRARAACARQAWPKIKPGGYLVYDNLERARYGDSFHEFTQGRHYSIKSGRLRGGSIVAQTGFVQKEA